MTSEQFTGAYTYPYASAAPRQHDQRHSRETRSRLSSAVGLVNGYFDILPRGLFTPYVGAGIGFVYNEISRYRYNQED